MIKFFRKIRLTFLAEGKTGHYLKYAIGEILLVVIGILIALQINNWNEEQKLERKRQTLIQSLIDDFEYNLNEISETVLPFQDSLINQMKLFFELSSAVTPTVGVDSLRTLAVAFFRGYAFYPNMTTYNEAASTGNLSLLRNNELLQQFTIFTEEHDNFIRHKVEAQYSYFSGSLWDFRKQLPLEFIAGQSPMPGLTYDFYISKIGTPISQNSLSNSMVLNQNIRNRLSGMHQVSQRIVEILQNMQRE